MNKIRYGEKFKLQQNKKRKEEKQQTNNNNNNKLDKRKEYIL